MYVFHNTRNDLPRALVDSPPLVWLLFKIRAKSQQLVRRADPQAVRRGDPQAAFSRSARGGPSEQQHSSAGCQGNALILPQEKDWDWWWATAGVGSSSCPIPSSQQQKQNGLRRRSPLQPRACLQPPPHPLASVP